MSVNSKLCNVEYYNMMVRDAADLTRESLSGRERHDE